MIFFKRHDYIEVYKNAFSKRECETIISYFERKPKNYGNITINGIGRFDTSVKRCLQLEKPPTFSDNTLISNILYTNLCKCLEKYKQKYPELNFIYKWKIDNNYNIQKYSTPEDGYKSWHCEHGMDKENITTQRVLAWMVYLNNAKSGTEFFRYPTINPGIGQCIIWPAFWTHTHRGVCPNQGIKYIATGWASFEKI